jgi:hypothetical protein
MRLVIENVLLFLLPAAVYCAWRFLRAEPRGRTLKAILDGAPLVGLFVAGALLVAATRIYYATTSPGGPPNLTYTPPRMGKDGSIEPGQLK